jgi:hypothetical protein
MKKAELMKKVECQYEMKYLQKLNWYSYLNKRKHENQLIKQIESEFGSDVEIIIGIATAG